MYFLFKRIILSHILKEPSDTIDLLSKLVTANLGCPMETAIFTYKAFVRSIVNYMVSIILVFPLHVTGRIEGSTQKHCRLEYRHPSKQTYNGINMAPLLIVY